MGTFGTGTEYAYDSMGRVIRTQEATRNIPWSSGFSAVYDLEGNLSSLTYPDGRQITQVWDGAGHLATVTSPAAGQSGGFTYLSGPSSVGGVAYTADGAESAFVLGAGIVQSNTYNNRLQLCQTQVGTVLPGSSQATSVLNKNYFHALTPETLCQNATGNNGNIWSIADIQKPTLSQSLTYDSLNRLLTASSTDYVQINNRFDSFGNMILQNNNKSPLSYSINPLTNQLLRNNTDFQYDAAGNLQVVVNAFATETYSSNALGQLEAAYSGNDPKNFYYYNANDLRSTKTVGTSSIDYEYFNGQLMAELSSDGTWTDHIYANGKKIASASNSDVRSHLSGIIPASGPTPFAQCSMAAPLYPVKTGDQLAFRMYERNASAGVSLLYGDGTNSDASCGTDQYGECLKQEATAGSWVNRVVNLGAIANGKTLNSLILWNNAGAPTGQFDVMIADMSITSLDGTVTQLIGETATGAYSSNGSSGITSLSCVSEKVKNTADFAGVPQTIRYYLGDQVDTAQLELTSGGWPIWKGEFNPFGGEIDPQTTSNNYKFTGKERDTESGFDYFGARYYGSDVGRFISPDRTITSRELANPQSWNKYSYTFNNPLKLVDPDGLWPAPTHHEINHDVFMSKVGAHGVAVLNRASDRADSFFGGGQRADQSKAHSMTNGDSIYGTGMAADKRAAAYADTYNFIFGEISQAVSSQLAYEAKGGTGYSDDALTHFGYAAHAVEDGTSPEHVGEQPWYGYSNMASDYQHYQQEKHDALGQTPRGSEALYQARVQAAAYWQYFNQQLEQQRLRQKNK